MIDINSFIKKQRKDSKTGTRTYYKHYCNKCKKDRGYQRKDYDQNRKYPGICHFCANDIKYSRLTDRTKNKNVDFDDFSIKRYNGKNCKHYKTNCLKCGKDRGYLQKQSWLINCFKCSASQTENKCREIFESKFNKLFPSVRPDFLKNPETKRNLELDGYCEELKLAFEYDGRQHYEPWDKNKPEELIKVQQRDKLKDSLCKENGVILVRIPYWENKDLKTYINKLIKEIV